MELFKTFQVNFAIVGIIRHAYLIKSRKMSFTFSINWITAILGWMFLVCQAKTFIEYTTVIYVASALTVVAISFAIVISQIQNIFEFIDRCVEMIMQKGDKMVLCNDLEIYQLW